MTTTRLLAKEQPHHLRAFEHYYGLGEQRSYESVADRVFRWGEHGEALGAVVRLAGASARARHRDRVRGCGPHDQRRNRPPRTEHTDRAYGARPTAKAIAEGDIRMTMSDLDKLIRLEAFLSDEPESRHELVLSELKSKTDQELREVVRQEVEVLEEIRETPR